VVERILYGASRMNASVVARHRARVVGRGVGRVVGRVVGLDEGFGKDD
jgi:hypothetical protein